MVGYMNFGQGTSDITGYYQDGREFAAVGLVEDAAVFVDITDPVNPFEVGRIGGTPNIWRDLKYWNRHVYIGTEAQDGVKVISVDDPDNPILVHTITDFTNSHNIHIDAEGYLYVVGAADHDLWIYDLSNPSEPDSVGAWEGEYLHDIEVYNNKLYGAAIYSGLFYIVDVSDKTNPTTLISHETGIDFGTHDCAVTENENYLIIADEKASGHISIWDISDYENINRVSEYIVGSNHSVHNVYVRPGTDLAIISYYVDGTRVLDISDPTNPIEVGYFDTSDLTGLFDGNWGTYAYLPSGYIISSDRSTGLYILKSPLLPNFSMEWSDCTDIVGDNLTCYGDIYQAESEVMQEIINLNTELAGLNIEDISSFSAGRVFSIDLSSIGLTSLALPYNLGNLSSLSYLQLQNNNLLSISESILNVGSLLELDLSYNQLTSIPDDIGILTNLEILKLNNNKMLSLPSTLCDFPDDCFIDATGNRLCPDFIEPVENCITTISYQNCDECESGYWFENFCSDKTDVGVLWDLIGVNDTLNGYNPMEIGNIQIGSPTWVEGELIYLNLSNHNLTNLPDNIGNLNNLKELDLKNNSIIILPDNITSLNSLLILRLHNNLLSELPDDIGDLINLEELYLSGNQLTSIPESIGSLQNIQKLFISDNQLTSLPSTICNLPADCNIQLNNNCIAETYDCIPDPGDQNECSSMNLINAQPADYQLFAPFPNPFNPLAKIEYNLPYTGDISLVIYDIMGRQVEILYNGKQHLGNYTISWDASNYSSGVYFIKMNVGDSQTYISNSQKLVLLK